MLRAFPPPPLPLERTLTCSVVALATLFSLLKPVSAIDLNIFMRMGSWMAAHGTLLEVEPFALAAEGTPFQNGTWLAQWVLFRVHALGGYPALQAGLAALSLATLVVSGAHLVARGGWRWSGAGVLFVLAFLLQNLAIRPQSFSIPLFASIYLLLDRFPERRFTPPLLFLLMASWTNLHGAFPIAFALPAAFGLDAMLGTEPEGSRAGVPLRRWVLLGVVLATATLLNPYGPSIYRYILENSTLPVSRGLSEWLPPDPRTFLGGRFYLSLLLAGALMVALRRQVRPSDLVLLLAFALLGARSQRMIVWWGVASAPILVRWLASRFPPPRPALVSQLHSAVGYGVLALFLLLFVKSAPVGTASQVDARGDHPSLDQDTPVEAATFLRDRPPGRLFHRLEWGSYLAWRLPAWRTFIDIRVWIFPQPVWDAYLSASRGEPGWQALMDRYGITTLALSRETQVGLIEAASMAPGWRQIHSDRLAVVFQREGSVDRPADGPAGVAAPSADGPAGVTAPPGERPPERE